MAAVIVGEERYVFDCEWYDQQAELIRYYRITFYPTDQTIEMVSQLLRVKIIINLLGILKNPILINCRYYSTTRKTKGCF